MTTIQDRRTTAQCIHEVTDIHVLSISDKHTIVSLRLHCFLAGYLCVCVREWTESVKYGFLQLRFGDKWLYHATMKDQFRY